MSILQSISTFVGVLLLMSCTKTQSEYIPATASAQHKGVIVCYEEGFWGQIESLQISAPNIAKSIPFTPSTVSLNGTDNKCLYFSIPLPDYNQMSWDDEKANATGAVDVKFKSSDVDITLSFGFELHIRADMTEDAVGGSSIKVSSVTYGSSMIMRDGHTLNDKFIFDIKSLI